MKLKLVLSLSVICSISYLAAKHTTPATDSVKISKDQTPVTDSAKTNQKKKTVNEIVNDEFKKGAIALIAALKTHGHHTDAQAIEAVRDMYKTNKNELLKKARSGSLTGTFSKDLQEAIAAKLTGNDFSKLTTLAGLLNK